MSATGWAELTRRVRWTFDHPPGCTEQQIRYREMNRWTYGTRHIEWPYDLTLYSADWQEIARLPRAALGISGGNHNWYHCDRYDITFRHPTDGWDWYGRLITGGLNSTFQVRRTQSSSLLTPKWLTSLACLQQLPNPTHQFKRPVIELVDGDCFRVADGKETKWFAKQFPDPRGGRSWFFAEHIGDLFAQRLTGEALAA